MSMLRFLHPDLIKVFRTTVLAIAIISVFSCGQSNDPAEAKYQIHLQYLKIDTAGPTNPWAKFSGDVNNDGINDIIIGGQKGPMVWYEFPEWKKHLVSKGGYDTVDGEVGDMDHDGDLDIVMGGIRWYENPGKLDQEPNQSWPEHRVANHPTHDIEIADVNQDQRIDIISRDQSEFGSKSGNSIHIWLNLGQDQWKEEVLECPHGEGIHVSDLDGDQDQDIVIGGIWFENGLSDGVLSWTRHEFTEWHANSSVQVADINGDQRKDIILAPAELAGSFHKISWFEAAGSSDKSEWIEHLILDSIECVIHSLSIGDLDKNGHIDIGYAEMHQGSDPDEVVLLLNQDKGIKWTKQIISDQGSHGLRIDDVNNDGRLDVFGANWSGDYQPVEVWLNNLK